MSDYLFGLGHDPCDAIRPLHDDERGQKSSRTMGNPFSFGDERLPGRFWDKVSPETNTGCWLWTAYANKCEYGVFRWNHRSVLAHRVAYESLVCAVPEGLELDHLCRVRCCVNPDHLEPVTHAENVRRGEAVAASIARLRAITHCPRGHEYTEENTILWRGNRKCRKCVNARDRERYKRRYVPTGIKMADRTHCPQGHPYNEDNTLRYKGSRICRECNRLKSAYYNAKRRRERAGER